MLIVEKRNKLEQSTCIDTKPVVLILCEYYLPGFRAGGPMRSINGMADRLATSYRMIVLARDRDMGDSQPYPFLLNGAPQQQTVGGAIIWYLAPEQVTPWYIRGLLRSIPHDVLYVNSCFSKCFSIAPLWMRRLHVVPTTSVILAPRGEFGKTPLRLRSRLRKRLYLTLSGKLGIFKDILWHASSEIEAREIQSAIGGRAQVSVARDLAAGRPAASSLSDDTGLDHPASIAKSRGSLSVVFLSRISPKKNLSYALELLRDIRQPITMDIYGPKEDAAYWQTCEEIIHQLPPIHTVRYQGMIEHANVRDVLTRYHLMLFPTQSENFGHVILEALTAGCLVATSDQTPWTNLETEGAGWTIPLANPDTFRNVIEKCALMDSDEFATFRRRAFDLGVRTLDDPEATQSTDRMLRRALESN
jgi:glycosyltransferase involved in cell wall biosynthesis